MPTFNSCTKYVGSPDMVHDRTPDCHPVFGHGCIDDLTTERSFDSQATWVIDELFLFYLHAIHGRLYNQALADVRSTGAGI